MFQDISLNNGIFTAGQVNTIAGIGRSPLVDVVILNYNIAVGIPVGIVVIRRSACPVPIRPTWIITILAAFTIPLLNCYATERIIDKFTVLDYNIAELGWLVTARFQAFDKDSSGTLGAVKTCIVHNSGILKSGITNPTHYTGHIMYQQIMKMVTF